MARAKARRKAKATPYAERRRRNRAAKSGARKVPETTVVHVDREIYGLLGGERRPEDRSMNAPLRRLLGLDRRRRKREAETPAQQPEAAAVS